jgi:hypothetical protein
MVLIRRDQNLNIVWLIPALAAFHAGAAWFCAAADAHWPGWVLLPAVLQFVSFTGYMIYLLKTITRGFVLMNPSH